MPFNETSKRLERIWAFVDQFIAGGTADRSDFDVAFNDVVNSTNDAVAYLEGLIAVIAAEDVRILGLKATVPTTRNDASALQDGDQYISSAAADLGVIYVRNGGAWIRASDLPAASTYFKTLPGAVDAPTLRGLLGLGSAATSASSAFASAAQGAKADAAVQAPSGIANTITDWNNVHASGTGFYIGDAAAANTPTAHTYTGYYIKANATNGVLMAFSPSNTVAYRRFYAAGVWGSWSEVPHGAALLELQALVRTRGDLVVGGASAWDILGIGTSGQVLSNDGTDLVWSDIPDTLGEGQTWTDVSGSRTQGTAYQNTTGRAIMVAVSMKAGGTTATKIAQVSPDNSTWTTVLSADLGANQGFAAAFIVPAGWYYKTNTGGSTTNWMELA